MDENEKRKLMKSGIECVSATDFVKIRPEMYWGTSAPELDNAVEAIVKQLELFGHGDDVKILHDNDWCYVGSKYDWITSGLEHSETVEKLFNQGYGIPEAGDLSLRVEFFLKIMAEHLMLWRDNNITKVKGNYSEEQKKYLENNYQDYITVAFRGNTYKK